MKVGLLKFCLFLLRFFGLSVFDCFFGVFWIFWGLFVWFLVFGLLVWGFFRVFGLWAS